MFCKNPFVIWGDGFCVSTERAKKGLIRKYSMPIKVRKVNIIRNAIKRVLRSEGAYSKVLDESIDLLAQVTHLREKAFLMAAGGFKDDEKEGADEHGLRDGILGAKEDDGTKPVVFQYSREGDRRYRVNPAYSIFIDLMRENQRLLNDMCMTGVSTNTIQEDEVDRLMEGVSKIINNE